MPQAVRHLDLCAGHGCWPPRPNATASLDVYINLRGAHRLRDLWQAHCCGPACHGAYQKTGSPDVFVNSRPIARVGDEVSCGTYNMTGSLNVFVNDGYDREDNNNDN